MKRRAWLMASAAALAGPALALRNGARVAVPMYSPADLLQGLYGHALRPLAQDFVRQAQALSEALSEVLAGVLAGALSGGRSETAGLMPALMAAPTSAPTSAPSSAPSSAPTPPPLPTPVHTAWVRCMLAWEQLSAVAVGPLITRRSLHVLDFQPTRPALIQRALAAGPGWDLALVGSPAKGLPALEWLLWAGPRHANACAYALQLAQEIVAEAQALEAGFSALASQTWDDDNGPPALAELINQWVGGLERLRWTAMEKPLRANRPAELPRALSGQTAAAWAARWQGLRALAVGGGSTPPAPGQGSVPLETWLRGRGLNPVADGLRRAVQRSDAALQGLRPGTAPLTAAQAAAHRPARPLTPPAAPKAALAAAGTLASLKRLAEEQVAPALDVRLGFSDADGD